MRAITIYIVLTGMIAFLSSCIREDLPPCIDQTELYIPELTIDPVYSPFESTESESVVTCADESCQLRITIDVFRKGDDQPTEHYVTITDDPNATTLQIDKSFQLPFGTYELVIWADYAHKGLETDEFYNTSRLVMVTPAGTYRGNTDLKDAFYTSEEVILTDRPVTLAPTLAPPFAKYRIIGTHVDQYISKLRAKSKSTSTNLDGLRVKVMYQLFFPYAFNAMTGKPNDAETGVTFTADIIPSSDTELTVASDFVWVNGESSAVDLVLVVYDSEGNVIGQSNSIHVPYSRKKLTTIRADFATLINYNTGSGIGIDPNFEGEYNITIPDL